MATEDERPRSFDEFELRLGDVMRGERATLGRSLLEVRRELRIKAAYVAAIENADIATFENPGFVAGYVRSYARYLGIDPEWALRQFCLEADFTPPSGLPAILAPGAKSAALKMKPKPENRDALGDPNAMFIPHSPSLASAIEPVAVGSILAVLVLIGSLSYGGWSVLRAFQQIQILPADQTPMVTASVDAMRGVARVSKFSLAGLVANGFADRSSANALSRTYRSPAPEKPVYAPHDEPISAIEPDATDLTGAPTRGANNSVAVVSRAFAQNTDPAHHPDGNVSVATVGSDSLKGEGEKGRAPKLMTAAPTVQIAAVQPSWVRVTAADGVVLLQKILVAGQKWTVPQTAEPAFLRADNPASIYFVVDGTPYGPAAHANRVVQHLSLSAGSLKETYDVAPLSRNPALAKTLAITVAVPPIMK